MHFIVVISTFKDRVGLRLVSRLVLVLVLWLKGGWKSLNLILAVSGVC